VRGEVGEDVGQRRVLRALLDQHADHRQSAIGRSVHEVHLHRGVGAVDGVLALGVEVELHQLVGLAAVGDAAATIDVGLHGVAVVEDVERGGSIGHREASDVAGRDVGVDVDRRLLGPLPASDIVVGEVRPALRAGLASVAPVQVVGVRRGLGVARGRDE